MSFSSRQIQAMMRDPLRMALNDPPRRIHVESPLADLLDLLPPRVRQQVRWVEVGQELGYLGRRVFPSAEAALHWVRPHEEMLEDDWWPGESWRDKRFRGPITLGLLRANSADAEALERLDGRVLAVLRHRGMVG